MIVKTMNLYADKPGVTLTTYVLSDSPEMLRGQKRPAVLICPGGAYLGCSDREAEPVALRFAAMGYHAFVLRYSVYTSDGQPLDLDAADMPVKPDNIHPAPMRDIGRAFLMIREQADDWLIDMDRIAICGFSAGAHNAAMYAVYYHTPLLTEHFDCSPEMLKPAAMILGYGLGNYHLMIGPDAPLTGEEKEVSAKAAIAFLGTPTPSDELLDAVSPAFHVTENAPPTFLWATAADILVPVANTLQMAHALAKAGVPFEVHVFEEGIHGLSLADQSTASDPHMLEPDAAQWIGLVEKWLSKRFALPIPDEPAWVETLKQE